MKVDFIGIGGQKCATSWLHKCLEEHPEVCVPKEKETHFFTQHDEPQKYLEEYEKAFAECGSETVRGEISTSYLAGENAPEHIHSLFPDMKLVVSLRDPVERALSHIRHLQSKNKLPNDISAKAAVEEYPEIIEFGLYGKHLKRYLSFFSKEQLHVILLDDIKNNPKKVVRELYTFLEVSEEFTPSMLNKKYNTSAARSSRIFWVINKLYLTLYKTRIGRGLIKMLKKLGLRTSTLEKALHFSFGGAKELEGKHDKELLRACFEDDVKMLQNKIAGEVNENWS